MTREQGYYWIRFNGELEIGYALQFDDGNLWQRAGSDNDYEDDEVVVLSERLLPPDWDKGPPIKSEA